MFRIGSKQRPERGYCEQSNDPEGVVRTGGF